MSDHEPRQPRSPRLLESSLSKSPPPAQRRYLVAYSLQELLINVAALMEHHSRRLLDFTETKADRSLDERMAAAACIKATEAMVQRIQVTICQAEQLG